MKFGESAFPSFFAPGGAIENVFGYPLPKFNDEGLKEGEGLLQDLGFN